MGIMKVLVSVAVAVLLAVTCDAKPGVQRKRWTWDSSMDKSSWMGYGNKNSMNYGYGYDGSMDKSSWMGYGNQNGMYGYGYDSSMDYSSWMGYGSQNSMYSSYSPSSMEKRDIWLDMSSSPWLSWSCMYWKET